MVGLQLKEESRPRLAKRYTDLVRGAWSLVSVASRRPDPLDSSIGMLPLAADITVGIKGPVFRTGALFHRRVACGEAVESLSLWQA